MKITALQEYGMRCLLQLAMGGWDRPQTTTSIAQKEGLSRDYVEKILFQLRRANVVRSVRGINGGYILNHSPEKISIGQVLMILSEKPIRMNRIKKDLCRQFPGKETQCVHLSGCTIRMLWSTVMLQVFGVLNHLPLSFLIGSEEEVHTRLLDVVQKSHIMKENNTSQVQPKVEVSI